MNLQCRLPERGRCRSPFRDNWIYDNGKFRPVVSRSRLLQAYGRIPAQTHVAANTVNRDTMHPTLLAATRHIEIQSVAVSISYRLIEDLDTYGRQPAHVSPHKPVLFTTPSVGLLRN